MAKITFVTGGQRSGKSRYAEQLAESTTSNPFYLATSRIWDDEFRARVQRHQDDRGEHWTTLEEEKFLNNLDLSEKTVVVDCVTLWLTNFFHDNGYEVEKALEQAKAEWDKLIQQDCHLIVVSNEIGMGVIPMDEATRKFTDLQGWMNQHIAASADKVVLMVSGLPLVVK